MPASEPDAVFAEDLFPRNLGDGAVLHVTRTQDAAEAFAVIDADRARLREWLPWVDATTSIKVEREFLRSLELTNAMGLGLHATIRCDGAFGGLVGLRIDTLRRSAEVGYWLAQSAVGRGVMTRAVAAMADLAFDELEMHRFELLAATGNLRSRAIADRLGLSFEGIRREAEELASGFVDLAMYAVLARDWPGAARVVTIGKPNN